MEWSKQEKEQLMFEESNPKCRNTANYKICCNIIRMARLIVSENEDVNFRFVAYDKATKKWFGLEDTKNDTE